jgi:hypothetical protein
MLECWTISITTGEELTGHEMCANFMSTTQDIMLKRFRFLVAVSSEL